MQKGNGKSQTQNDFLTRGFHRFIGEILQGAKGRQYSNTNYGNKSPNLATKQQVFYRRSRPKTR
jgi:hypothetical protein